jgi:cupin 2 domain-containing protein
MWLAAIFLKNTTYPVFSRRLRLEFSVFKQYHGTTIDRSYRWNGRVFIQKCSEPKNMQPINNLFTSIPEPSDTEFFEDLLRTPGIGIERIVSKGHASPAEGWYDQDEHEWVMVVQGAAVITFEQGGDVRLESGDYINIPAHCRHKVSWTNPEQATVWLAVFYSA